ncbi:MAG: hypothetical protein HRU26_03925 [Psychroserpens sp.]|nr:hypothetical protein [Psychroserpens sp.]
MAIALPIFIKSLRLFSTNATLSSVVLAFVFILLFFGVHFVCRYFEYDSDGEKVIVINRGLLLSNYLNYREHVVEFDKQDLVAYSFKNYFVYRALTLYVKDSRGHKRKESFNITLVTRRKRKYMRQSLKKIVKANRKAENR